MDLLGHSLPPNSSILSQSHIAEYRVPEYCSHGNRIARHARPRRHPEEPVLRVDCPQLPVAVRSKPGNVVPDHRHFVARQFRAHHGKVCLAARRWEGGGDVLLDAVGPGDPGDEHVLCQPALLASHGRAEPESETFLAEQRVAAVARAKAENLQLVGAMSNQHLISGKFSFC